MISHVKGIDRAKRALSRKNAKFKRIWPQAIVDAGLEIQKRSQELTPVDTGNLRNSAFTRAKGDGLDTRVIVGYTANYAVHVHENVAVFHHVGQAKFLSAAIVEKRPEIVRRIKVKMSR